MLKQNGLLKKEYKDLNELARFMCDVRKVLPVNIYRADLSKNERHALRQKYNNLVRKEETLSAFTKNR